MEAPEDLVQLHRVHEPWGTSRQGTPALTGHPRPHALGSQCHCGWHLWGTPSVVASSRRAHPKGVSREHQPGWQRRQEGLTREIVPAGGTQHQSPILREELAQHHPGAPWHPPKASSHKYLPPQYSPPLHIPAQHLPSWHSHPNIPPTLPGIPTPHPPSQHPYPNTPRRDPGTTLATPSASLSAPLGHPEGHPDPPKVFEPPESLESLKPLKSPLTGVTAALKPISQ